jgi:hypothetical protein
MGRPVTALDRFWRWYRRLGEPLSGADTDLVAVVTSAALLEVSEFRFFELAYDRWFGRPAGDGRIEPIFNDYIFRDAVPHWVRHLARQVLSLADRGELDRETFDLERPEMTAEMRTRGILYSVAVFVLLVLFCLLVSSYKPY